ncbi:MAG TPA: hypothetical protein VK493_07370, partial [Bryobacteraceae bacterium]|nr:hypothetical protein [Bryobacteraceae bacterium]
AKFTCQKEWRSMMISPPLDLFENGTNIANTSALAASSVRERSARLSDFPLEPLDLAVVTGTRINAAQRDARLVKSLRAQAVSRIVSGGRSIIWTV